MVRQFELGHQPKNRIGRMKDWKKRCALSSLRLCVKIHSALRLCVFASLRLCVKILLSFHPSILPPFQSFLLPFPSEICLAFCIFTVGMRFQSIESLLQSVLGLRQS